MKTSIDNIRNKIIVKIFHEDFKSIVPGILINEIEKCQKLDIFNTIKNIELQFEDTGIKNVKWKDQPQTVCVPIYVFGILIEDVLRLSQLKFNITIKHF